MLHEKCYGIVTEVLMAFCHDSLVNVKLKLRIQSSKCSFVIYFQIFKFVSLFMSLISYMDLKNFLVLFFLMGLDLNLFAYLNSSSTHIGASRVSKRGMTYLGACKRPRIGFMRMDMMKLNMLILQNWRI